MLRLFGGTHILGIKQRWPTYSGSDTTALKNTEEQGEDLIPEHSRSAQKTLRCLKSPDGKVLAATLDLCGLGLWVLRSRVRKLHYCLELCGRLRAVSPGAWIRGSSCGSSPGITEFVVNVALFSVTHCARRIVAKDWGLYCFRGSSDFR